MRHSTEWGACLLRENQAWVWAQWRGAGPATIGELQRNWGRGMGLNQGSLAVFGNQQSQAPLDKEDLVAEMISENLTSSANQQWVDLWVTVYNMEIPTCSLRNFIGLSPSFPLTSGEENQENRPLNFQPIFPEGAQGTRLTAWLWAVSKRRPPSLRGHYRGFQSPFSSKGRNVMQFSFKDRDDKPEMIDP